MNETTLTPAQLMLWAGQQLAPDSPQYNCVLTFDLRGPLDRDRFSAAFRQLLAECDSMRTVFHLQRGDVQQRVLTRPPRQLEQATAQLGPTELGEWIARHATESFDLSHCCYRAILLRLGVDRHLFFLNQHHLILDAWGVSVQFKRLRELYGARGAGAELAGTLPLFIDYRRALRLPTATPNYWKEKGAGLPRPLLGTSSANATTRTPRTRLTLSEARMRGLRELAAQHGIKSWTQDLTFFNIFATLTTALVYRLTGEPEVTLGVVSANRGTAKERRLPAQLMEVLPLYGRVEAEDSFFNLYERQRESAYQFLRSARAGLANPGLAASFHTVLNYVTARCGHFADGIHCTTDWHSPQHGDPGHHLRVLVHDYNGQGTLTVEFDLNAGIFSERERREIPNWFMRLFDAMCADASQQPAAVHLFAAAEWTRLQSSSSGPTVRRRDPSVLEGILRQTYRLPEATAIEAAGDRVTYAELDRRTARLAASLRKCAGEDGGHVGLFLPGSTDAVIGMLACWRAGFAYLPLPVDTPPESLRYMASQAAAVVIVTNRSHRASLPDLGLPVHLIDGEVEVGAAPARIAPASAPPSAPAYTIYTSGSTGRPKGVTVTHGALLNYIAFAADRYVRGQQPVFALFTTLGVDLTVTSLFTPLFVGGRIRIYPEHDPGIPDIRVLDVFADDRCDVVKLTPSHLNLIRDKGLASATIRSLIVGGEQLSTTLVEAMRTNLPPDVHIFNEYGPTEATVGCIVSVYRPEYALRGAVPIGRPIANTEAWILNEAGAAVPDGAPGEIYLGGTSLAKEYRFRPELTRERFVDHPFRVGGRLYRTGDRGRRNAEGDIEFLGRTDRQLKVRGFRIELAGIEGILMTHPRITGAVVDAVAGEDGSGSDLRLVAYYQSPAPLGNEELRTHLRKHLPHYSLPRVFVHMDTFPLTRSGKLDRTALPARNEPAPVEPYRYAAPEGEIEELLAEIWREVFGRERIGVHDAFLDVGGHSLTAIRLAARITATFDLEMPLHLVFTYPTIAQQASYLTDKLTQLLDLRDEAEKPN